MGVDGAVADLRRLPMFAEVEPGLLAHLEQASFLRKLARGQVLFIAGEPADHLFVVRAGLIKVHVTSDRSSSSVRDVRWANSASSIKAPARPTPPRSRPPSCSPSRPPRYAN
jgi:hypothetical protein